MPTPGVTGLSFESLSANIRPIRRVTSQHVNELSGACPPTSFLIIPNIQNHKIPPRETAPTHFDLPSCMATVNAEITACHEAAGITQQEDGSATELVGCAEAAEHVLLGPHILALRIVIE